jgi:hypothetical protein
LTFPAFYLLPPAFPFSNANTSILGTQRDTVMDFEIGNAWHWAFIACATGGSAWNACRVFFAEYEESHVLSLSPFGAFWYELAGSMAGWMACWELLPPILACVEDGACGFEPVLPRVLLLVVAVLGISGRIPVLLDRLLEALGELVSRVAGR